MKGVDVLLDKLFDISSLPLPPPPTPPQPPPQPLLLSYDEEEEEDREEGGEDGRSLTRTLTAEAHAFLARLEDPLVPRPVPVQAPVQGLGPGPGNNNRRARGILHHHTLTYNNHP